MLSERIPYARSIPIGRFFLCSLPRVIARGHSVSAPPALCILAICLSPSSPSFEISSSRDVEVSFPFFLYAGFNPAFVLARGVGGDHLSRFAGAPSPIPSAAPIRPRVRHTRVMRAPLSLSPQYRGRCRPARSASMRT
jgi:hypothetical protein